MFSHWSTECGKSRFTWNLVSDVHWQTRHLTLKTTVDSYCAQDYLLKPDTWNLWPETSNNELLSFCRVSKTTKIYLFTEILLTRTHKDGRNPNMQHTFQRSLNLTQNKSQVLLRYWFGSLMPSWLFTLDHLWPAAASMYCKYLFYLSK